MEKGKECYNCRFYRPIYTKGFCQFDKLDYFAARKTTCGWKSTGRASCIRGIFVLWGEEKPLR